LGEFGVRENASKMTRELKLHGPAATGPAGRGRVGRVEKK